MEIAKMIGSEFNLGRDSVIKAYIVSESLLWSAWNAVVPIFAVFITTQVKGGTIEVAGLAYSVYLLFRVVFELLTGKILLNSNDRKKFAISVIGLSIMSLAYAGFALANNLWLVFLFYSLLGLGMGIANPAKSALFSGHLSKNKATSQWASYDAITFFCMAISAAVGGIITKQFGFNTLFLLAAIINLLSIIPYIYKRKVLSYL